MIDYVAFFCQTPEAFPLYEAVREAICSAFAGVSIKVQKTQISFSNKHIFAVVSLPRRPAKSRLQPCINLTFGLGYRLEHPRVTASTEPYPGRWTHHVILQSETDVDEQMKEWLSDAYYFANAK